MGAVAIGKEDFQQTVEKEGIVFIDWWAPWCGPCRAFAPIYEKVAEANPDVTFAKINTDDPTMFQTTLSREYQLAQDAFGLTDAQLAGLAANSFRASFLPDERKRKFLSLF